MRRPLVALLLLGTPAAAEVREERFTSASLGREVAVSVHLPPSYGRGAARYPVVYALHGLFEGQGFWAGRGLAALVDALWERGELPEMLVVAVDGGNSFFANGRTGRFEDLVTRDLPAHVESAYRVRPGREGRALLGVSMGGYAALRIALARPELFRAAAAHSAMILTKPPTREDGATRWHLSAFAAVFGEPVDTDLWTAADPLAWAGRAEPGTAPALSFDCGASDRYGLFTGNEALHRRLLARGVRHEFALLPGDHGYDYVRGVLPRSLRFLAAALQGDGPGTGR